MYELAGGGGGSLDPPFHAVQPYIIACIRDVAANLPPSRSVLLCSPQTITYLMCAAAMEVFDIEKERA